MKRTAIITSSDTGYRGEREDLSGPAVKEIMEAHGYQVVSMEILPDDRGMLSKRMAEIADENQAELILTTGGTGFSPSQKPQKILWSGEYRGFQRLCGLTV